MALKQIDSRLPCISSVLYHRSCLRKCGKNKKVAHTKHSQAHHWWTQSCKVHRFLLQQSTGLSLNSSFLTKVFLAGGEGPWYRCNYYLMIKNCSFLCQFENLLWRLMLWDINITKKGNNKILFNPLTPMSDQDRISPYSINTISTRWAIR